MSEIKTNKISPRKGTTQTIGDSGDTVTIPSGVTLSNAGTISGIQNIDWDTTKKTTAFTAVNQTGYFVDTTSAAITVTFPASPSAGNVIGLKDYANTFDTNNLTINPNGNKIQGSTDNFIVSTEGSALQFIYVDSTRGWVLTDASKASDIAEAAVFVAATGGTVTCCGDYKIHTFTGPGTFTVTCAGNAAGSNTVDYLVVAGGAGGGGRGGGGGGGAGGYRSNYPSGCSGTPVTVTAYPITVGGGGSGTPEGRGSSGSNSVFSTITSAGGGGGGGGQPFTPAPLRGSGLSGGSGGGGASCFSAGGSGNTPPVSPPQGNNGGTANPSPQAGGGGGGAGVAGTNGSPPIGGPGGNGLSNSITGSSVTRGGGGGGASNFGAPSGGLGGTGGGGTGGNAPNPGGPSVGSTAGAANTGGGGGGGGNPGPDTAKAGGSGIVIIRYKYQ